MNVVVYTRENCSFCTSAKMLLMNKGISFRELKLNEDFTRESLKETFPFAKTYPVIVVDGMNIGGFTELKEMVDQLSSDTRKFLSERAGAL